MENFDIQIFGIQLLKILVSTYSEFWYPNIQNSVNLHIPKFGFQILYIKKLQVHIHSQAILKSFILILFIFILELLSILNVIIS